MMTQNRDDAKKFNVSLCVLIIAFSSVALWTVFIYGIKGILHAFG